MSLIKVLGYYLISVFSLEVLIMAFNKVNNIKSKIDCRYIIILLIGSVLVTINFYYSPPTYKVFANILVMYVSLLLISRESLFKSFIIYIILYFILFINEILTSSIVMIINVDDMNVYNSNIMLKALITLIDSVLFYYISSRKIVIKFINKITNKIKDNYTLIFIVFFSIIVFIVIDIRFFKTFSSKVYFSNFIILGCLLVILVLTIKAYLNIFKEKQKTEALLSFMTKYEKTIDKDRINKHELLNDLLILKSMTDKNSKEYIDFLDNLIDKFTNKGIKIKNVYKLPSGLKGVLYYKLYGLDEKGYDININVSKVAIKSLKQISSEDYASLYKIVGIVIDNAIEASNNTNNKYILIDIYGEDEIIVEISNSFKGKIDLNRLGEKYYSSKGKKRGLGLYIINKILRNSDIIFEQSINGKIFTTKITIKK